MYDSDDSDFAFHFPGASALHGVRNRMQRSPTCPKCLQNFEFKDFRPIGSHIPLLLSCGHSFCEGCLMKLGRKKEEIICPSCQEVTKLEPSGERGVKNLLPDIYLLGVLTYNKRAALESGQNRVLTGPSWNFGSIHHLSTKRQKSEVSKDHKDVAEECQVKEGEEGDAKKQVLCEECSQPATCICKSCDDCSFCEGCFVQFHKALKRLQKHQPLPLSFPRKADLECLDHSGGILEFFDKNLDEPICAHCIITEKHKGHEIVPIGEMDTDIKEALGNSLLSAKNTLSCLKASEKVISHAMPELTMIANQFCQDVRTYFNDLHTSLQIRESAILEEAAENFALNCSLSRMLLDCIQKQKTVEALIRECEFLSLQPQSLRLKVKELISKLNGLNDMECFAKRVDSEGDDLRFVVDEEKAEILKEIGAIEMKNGNIVEMLKLSEVSEEEQNLAKIKESHDAPQQRMVVEGNEILTEDSNSIPGLKKHVTYDAVAMSKLRASFELVYVTYVRTPENFFVQRCADKERLQHMMHNLNKYCRNSDKPDDLIFCAEKDDLVCAQFMADNNWYRARIISPKSRQQPDITPTWENGLPVEVQYIDYGNMECLPLARLRKIKPQFLEVPELAVPCSFVDIVPPNCKETWPLNSVKAFNALVGEKPLLMNIRCRFDGKLFVDLKRPEEPDEPTKDDDRPVSVRDALIFLEVARFRSPTSVPVDALKDSEDSERKTPLDGFESENTITQSKTEHTKPTRTYKEPNLPSIGEQTDIIVTHVVNPHEIYVQKFDSPINEVHEEIAKLYAGKQREGTNFPFPYRNLVCAARFNQDQMWYRGLVTAVHDDCKVDVQFVDYGNSETTSFSEIRRLPDSCLNLRRQAMVVKLKDVGCQLGGDTWSRETNKFLKDTILDKPMVLIPKEVDESGVLSVELCDTSTDDDIYINHLLVTKGYAVCTGPSSEAKAFLLPLHEEVGEKATASEYNWADECSEAASSTGNPEVSAMIPSYLPPSPPQSQVFEVVGTCVDSDGHIFGHKVAEHKELMVMQEKLNDGEMDNIPGLENTNDLQPNQPCVAQFSEDNRWYRVLTVHIIDEEHIEADFVDFGNKEVVHAKNLRLTAPFLDIPKQAVKLELFGITSVQDNGKYPPEALGTLNQIMVNHPFTAKLEGPQKNPEILKVSIKISTGEDLAEGLLKVGFAKKSNDEALLEHIAQHHEIQQQGLPADEEEIGRLASLSLQDDYIEQTLPQAGVHFDVTITQVDRPNVVFIQRLPPYEDDGPYSLDEDDTEMIAREHIDQLRRISMMMNSEDFFDDNSSVDHLRVGMACCARYSADDDWYRAKVKSVATKNGDGTGEVAGAEVLFVDYGTSEAVPIDRIKQIPEDFLELPVQAVRCELAGLYPPKNATGPFFRDTKWPIETMKSLYGTVANKRIMASIMDYGPPVKVLLFDRLQTDDGETGEVIDMCVCTKLAKAGLAVFNLDPKTDAGSDTENETQLAPSSKTKRSSTKLFELPGTSDLEDHS